jgi:hypothetical protein
MTLRDYEALGAAIREASTSVYNVVRTTTGGYHRSRNL